MINVVIINGQIVPHGEEDVKKIQSLNKNAIYGLDFKEFNTRTLTQNRAFHLYFNMVAVQLNNSGLYINKLIREDKYKADINWSGTLVKEQLWKPIQLAILDKKSTTQLERIEVDRIYNTLNRYLSNMGISVPFPNAEIKIKKD